MLITLSFPAKILWPNGRGHHMTRHKAAKKAKRDAYFAMKEVMPLCYKHNNTRIRWAVTFYPKTAHEIDRDNAAASLKAYQDGFALAMLINDTWFDNPEIKFGEPVKGGKIIVEFLP